MQLKKKGLEISEFLILIQNLKKELETKSKEQEKTVEEKNGYESSKSKEQEKTVEEKESFESKLDVCVDLTGSLPMTQAGLTDFVPGRTVSDATHRKRVKYEVKCADIGYGFLPFSFSSFGELEKDVVALLKRI
ncbi:hypothetical protein Tco_1416294 [Tanacetum coccineum]